MFTCGGTGKNLFLDFIGNKIIGENYYLVIGSNQELYEKHNSLLVGKLLVFVEEASGKDNFANNDILKSKITSKKMNVNEKMRAQYKCNDFTNFVFGTNNHNALQIGRRFAPFDASKVHKGDTEHLYKVGKGYEQ